MLFKDGQMASMEVGDMPKGKIVGWLAEAGVKAEGWSAAPASDMPTPVRSPGSPTDSGLHLDARSALEFLAPQDIPAEKIVVYGESLGSGIAVQLAAEHQFAAIVLEAPYTSMTDVARQHYGFLPVRWLLREIGRAHV